MIARITWGMLACPINWSTCNVSSSRIEVGEAGTGFLPNPEERLDSRTGGAEVLAQGQEFCSIGGPYRMPWIP